MGKMTSIKLVATDLDGTLLNDSHLVSLEDQKTLRKLGEQEIIRVIATGRNVRKIREVILDNRLFDYLIFSSGAGIIDCRQQERLIYHRNIMAETVTLLQKELQSSDLNFFVFYPVPENSRCCFFRGSQPCEEFDRYIQIHRDYAFPLMNSDLFQNGACQFLIMFKTLDRFQQMDRRLSTMFPGLKILRASSPLGTDYVWMEIFHCEVSKGNAVRFLCELNHIDRKSTLGIGNDFNDLDLLGYTYYSYLVDNAPKELKDKGFLAAPDHQSSALSFCVASHCP